MQPIAPSVCLAFYQFCKDTYFLHTINYYFCQIIIIEGGDIRLITRLLYFSSTTTAPPKSATQKHLSTPHQATFAPHRSRYSRTAIAPNCFADKASANGGSTQIQVINRTLQLFTSPARRNRVCCRHRCHVQGWGQNPSDSLGGRPRPADCR